MKPIFFASPSKLRAWLEKNHDKLSELWVGFHKKNSGTPSVTYPEALDEVLCFGWIDGVRKSIDETRYMNRFTPRKARSHWSTVNIRRVKELIAAGRMRPAGLLAFERRTDEMSALSSSEQRHQAELDTSQERQLRANEKAWEFFRSQAAWYRRTAIYWVTSAKKAETRAKRLATLIADSAAGRTIAPLTRKTAEAGKATSRSRSAANG